MTPSRSTFSQWWDGDHHRTQEITHRFEILPGLGPRRDILVGTARRAEFETFRRIPDPTVIGNEATALDQIVPFTSCQLILLHGTPSGTVSVDDTLSCHGYVFRTDGRQRRLATPRIQPLESDLRQRIERLIGAEKNQGTLFEMQFDIVFQHDRAREPHTGRYDDTTATLFSKRIDSIGEKPAYKGYNHRARHRIP